MTGKADNCGGTKLIFACSGGSDVGHLSDLGARAAAKTGAARMYCLAGIGGSVEPVLATTRAAAAILAIDGCAHNCAKKTLELAGFSNFRHLQLADLGFVKGQSEPTPVRVRLVAGEAVAKLK